MPSVNDIVELSDGSIGVISEELPSPDPSNPLFKVWFTDHHRSVTADDISQTLSAASYNVTDEVAVWPHLGEITVINGDEFTISIERSRFVPGLGSVTWTASHRVPRWRVIRDNDGRIEGVN